MADHQQASGPGRQNGLEGRESHEVQVLRRLVQHQQLGRWLTSREADEGSAHALTGAEGRERPVGECERKAVDA